MTIPITIFIKEEGGYEIILKALSHYKKRLQTLHTSPELQNSAAMFASVLNQEARKTIPKIDDIKKKVIDILEGNNPSIDVNFLRKALACYESDIQKAQDTQNEYFLKLVNLDDIKNDIKSIRTVDSLIALNVPL